MRENCRVFESVRFRPRNAVARTDVQTANDRAGDAARIAFSSRARGQQPPLLSARRVRRRGGSRHRRDRLRSLDAVGMRAGRRQSSLGADRVWYQLYLLGGRDAATAAIVARAMPGFGALVVTIDTAVAGQRERDLRNGAKRAGQRESPADVAARSPTAGASAMAARFLARRRNDEVSQRRHPGEGPMPYEDVGAALERSTVCWDDIGWIRERGAARSSSRACSARRTRDARSISAPKQSSCQTTAAASSTALRRRYTRCPKSLRPSGGRAEILLDGGIRRGSDVVKALCLGARAVLIGRAYAYGLGAAGGAGVARAIEILRSDIVRTLRLLGCHDVRSLDRSYVSASWADL